MIHDYLLVKNIKNLRDICGKLEKGKMAQQEQRKGREMKEKIIFAGGIRKNVIE